MLQRKIARAEYRDQLFGIMLYSTLIPAFLMIGTHLRVSAATWARSACGPAASFGGMTAPRSSKRMRIAGAATAFQIRPNN